MARKTIRQKIYDLLSDLEDYNSEEISKVLEIKLGTIKQTLWRDSTSEHPYFRRIKLDGVYYYTISGRFAKTIKDYKIAGLERDLRYNNWAKENYNAIMPKYLELKKENKKLKEKIKSLEG